MELYCPGKKRRNKGVTDAHKKGEQFERRKVNERSTEGEGACWEGVEMTTSPDQFVHDVLQQVLCTHVGTHGLWY